LRGGYSTGAALCCWHPTPFVFFASRFHRLTAIEYMSTDVERWKSLDAASYDDVAERFDAYSNRLSSSAAQRLLDLAAVGPGERVLDVGTGAGLLPFALLRAPVATGPIVGVDISTGMVAAAQKKTREAGIPETRLRFEQMDAESLTFGEGAFDVVLSAFALTHVPHPDVALREIFRVLRPAGRIALVVGSRPPLATFHGSAHAMLEVGRRLEKAAGRRLTADLLDRIVVEECGPAPHDHPRGSELSTRQNRSRLLVELVRGAGFVGIQRSWRNYQNEVATPEEFWDIHRTIRSDARKRLLDAPPELVERVRSRFMEVCRRTIARGGRMTFPISAVFVTARKRP
jgi:ubiquinone/menaquinone biosynthesis C-methylase UbiE